MSTSPPAETPEDALKAIANAAVAEAKRTAQGEPDPLVSAAFALGWQMAEIYQPEPSPEQASDGQGHLVGLSGLTPDQWAQVGLLQMQAGINKLGKTITAAGLSVPDAQAFSSQLDGLTDQQREAAVEQFHVKLLSTFTAADYRLGKAYGLGRALADATRNATDFRSQLDAGSVATLTAWTRDLSTAFPPHAGHVVASSLEAWAAWAKRPAGSVNDEAQSRAQLQAQGRLWRSMLSGEKRALDMLEARDYIAAGEQTLQGTATLVRPVIEHHWPLLGAVAGLFVVGVLVAVIADDAGGIVGGLGAILASLGIGWRGLGTSAGKTFAHLETPVWEASLDTTIYRRITPQRVLECVADTTPGTDEPSLVAAMGTGQAQPTPSAGAPTQPLPAADPAITPPPEPIKPAPSEPTPGEPASGE
ncbi:MAG TPA: hypothetical protein VIL82_01725 [Solirubrobacteraceae bacterium]|jgi:hypothetical protein